MTALGKYVIPLQKDGQALAFNIQTHDTIKYTPRNISAELDRALKDATKITEEDRTGYQYVDAMSERLFTRSIEISGYQKKDYHWFLADDINDTVFTGYSHPERREYLFFAVVNDRDLLRACLTDMQVITKRLESKYNGSVEEIKSLSIYIDQLNNEIEEAEKGESAGRKTVGTLTFGSRIRGSKQTLESSIEKRDGISSKLELIQNSKFAVILTPEVVELKEKVIEQYNNMDKEILSFPLYIGNISGIQIADVNIVFKTPDL